jgi:hypothetical protein
MVLLVLFVAAAKIPLGKAVLVAGTLQNLSNLLFFRYLWFNHTLQGESMNTVSHFCTSLIFVGSLIRGSTGLSPIKKVNHFLVFLFFSFGQLGFRWNGLANRKGPIYLSLEEVAVCASHKVLMEVDLYFTDCY